MIRLSNGTMDDKVIMCWEVWFKTPFGVTKYLSDAVRRVQEYELNPDTCIIPVPVAFSGDKYEVIS